MNDFDMGWLGFGVEFHKGGPGDQRFVNRLSSAAVILKNVDAAAWRQASGYQSIFLVIRPTAGLTTPKVKDMGVDEGSRQFLVDYDWDTPQVADRVRGPWQLAGHICLVLVIISEKYGVPLPRLPVPR